jgi:hypothetical protein
MSGGPEVVNGKRRFHKRDCEFSGGHMRRPAQVVEFVVLEKTVVSAVIQGDKNEGDGDSRSQRSKPGWSRILLWFDLTILHFRVNPMRLQT